MAKEEIKIKNSSETSRSFVIGFILSLLLTFAAYFAVVYHVTTDVGLTTFIIFLAFVQLVVQLLFFLHLGRESRPRWNLNVFLTSFSIILFIVVASIWIMQHLYHNLMTPQEMDNYTMQQENLYK